MILFMSRCNTNFWFGRRKHHCRNCGFLFCRDCSSRIIPIPSEQLYHPVRVCDDCYVELDTKLRDVMINPSSVSSNDDETTGAVNGDVNDAPQQTQELEEENSSSANAAF